VKIRSRIERLEDEMLPLPARPPEFMTVCFIDSDKRVVDTLVFELGQTRAPGHNWRTAKRSLREKGNW
jgi:hypothetical protein